MILILIGDRPKNIRSLTATGLVTETAGHAKDPPQPQAQHLRPRQRGFGPHPLRGMNILQEHKQTPYSSIGVYYRDNGKQNGNYSSILQNILL